jgi:hypothetical protein
MNDLMYEVKNEKNQILQLMKCNDEMIQRMKKFKKKRNDSLDDCGIL